MTLFATQGVEVTMNIVNYYDATTAITVKPTGRVADYRHYAFNTDEQAGAEALQALMAFLVEKYSNPATGLITNWIIGNEVNNNNPWYFAGNCDVNGWVTTPKQIYDVFKYIDTPQSAAYTQFALPIIGASNWAQLGCNKRI